jgi:hypothetical protein
MGNHMWTLYLGINFDHKLLWNEHINNVANKTFTRISELPPPPPLLGYKSSLSPLIKLNYT